MMTETLSQARQQITKAVQTRIVEVMAKVVDALAVDIADAAVTGCDNPLDEASLNESIAEVLANWDFSQEIAAVIEAPAAV